VRAVLVLLHLIAVLVWTERDAVAREPP